MARSAAARNATAPAARLRAARSAVLVGAVLVAATCGAADLTVRAFSLASAPAVLERPRPQGTTSPTEQREPGESWGKSEKRVAVEESPRQLAEGFPAFTDSSVALGPQWATCFVETQEAGRVHAEGVASARNVLEEWVVRGERERLDEFRAWRRSQAAVATVRCAPKSAESTEGEFCLECVSNSGASGLPFTAMGRTVVAESNVVMTFGGLDQCVASTAGNGYCKTGIVAVAM